MRSKPKVEFTLSMKDLESGHVYLSEHGTVVLVASDYKFVDNFVFNIENGIGCYREDTKFRKFKVNEVHLTTSESSEMFVEFA